MKDHEHRQGEYDMHEDPLHTARGIAWGIVIGSCMWAVLIGAYFLWLAN